MLKLGKLTDYATVLMTVLAAETGRLHSAHDLAERTRVSAPTVSKLLKLLTKGGLVESIRGAHGGYRLARPAAAITVADIVTALEGPFGLTECSVHQGGCNIEPFCGVRANWSLINTAIRSALEAVTLAQMALPMHGASLREVPLIPMHRPAASK
ncbi:MAG: SUF system Fe-S cluster assembly regulator [Gammaproteobacteria bacterium]|nr:SUF system Fe-S cluster assembly regulator [Gammaproteobacteria bacterium]